MYSDYLPLFPGGRLKYEWESVGKRRLEIIEVVNGFLGRRIVEEIAVEFSIDRRPEGLFIDGHLEMPRAPEQGLVWGWEKCRVESMGEQVRVRSGMFARCLKVSYLTPQGRNSERWYAPGVGMVKQVHRDAAGPFVRELISFQ